MTGSVRPLRGHRRFGPYYACRYVGVDPDRPRDANQPDDVDVVVWLLYARTPTDESRELTGVLYNRRRDQTEDRGDRWIARVHGSGHHHESPNERNFQGATEDEAVKQLWLFVNRPASEADYKAAVDRMAQGFRPGAGCA
jgi:hypothetical protein